MTCPCNHRRARARRADLRALLLPLAVGGALILLCSLSGCGRVSRDGLAVMGVMFSALACVGIWGRK